MAVTPVKDLNVFHEIIGGSEFSVFDFWAPWCPPCKAISPLFEKLAGEYPKGKFYKVDIDEGEAINEEVSPRMIPTFIIYKDGEKVGEVVGAVPEELEELFKKHLS